MNETISRLLLAIEAVVLLLPLSLLYGVLLAVLFDANLTRMLVNEPGMLIGMLFSGGGLFALWRLLGTAIVSGVAALREVPRVWLAFCLLIAAWVAIAWLVQLWIAFMGAGYQLQSALQNLLLGLYGAPALVPLVHLAAELRWRKGGAA